MKEHMVTPYIADTGLKFDGNLARRLKPPQTGIHQRTELRQYLVGELLEAGAVPSVHPSPHASQLVGVQRPKLTISRLDSGRDIPLWGY
jgi:hypothetical protein